MLVDDLRVREGSAGNGIPVALDCRLMEEWPDKCKYGFGSRACLIDSRKRCEFPGFIFVFDPVFSLQRFDCLFPE